jgi:ERCC4-related helicase
VKLRKTLIPRKGKDALGFHPQILSNDWLERYDKGLSPLFESAKMKALMKELKSSLAEAPTEKIIVFTQWRGFAAIVGRMLEQDHIEFVYYTVCLH